jgi:hypothetical protein
LGIFLIYNILKQLHLRNNFNFFEINYYDEMMDIWILKSFISVSFFFNISHKFINYVEYIFFFEFIFLIIMVLEMTNFKTVLLQKQSVKKNLAMQSLSVFKLLTLMQLVT